MSEPANLLFYIAVSGLIAHELDAVSKREWRLLFILRGMADRPARRLFVLIHIPFLVLLLWLVAHPSGQIRYWTMLALDVFMIVHAGLHWRLSTHPKYEFNTAHSRRIIFGTAALAAGHLIVLFLIR